MITCNEQSIMKHLKRVAVDNKVTIQVIPEKGNTKIKAHHFTRTVNKKTVAELIDLNNKGAAVSVVPQHMDGNGRLKKNVKAIRYLVVDIDRQISMQEIEALPIQPCIIIETSKGRVHIYYRVKCTTENFSRYSNAIAQALKADIQVCDLARAFRIAGTTNWKKEPVVAVLHRCEDQAPIPVQKLVRELGVDVPALRSKSTTQITSTLHDIKSKASEAELQNALKAIPSEDRAIWLHIGMALHSWSPTDGHTLWNQWSRSSKKYDQAVQDRFWISFNAGGGRSVGTIFYYANLVRNSNDKSTASLPIEDVDIAAYAATLLCDRLRIVGDDSYYVFGQNHWQRDSKAAARLMCEIVDGLLDVAENSGSDHAKRRLKQQATYAAAQKLLKGMNSFPELDAKADDFDKNPKLLGVPNGVVELRTGRFRKGRPEDMITITTMAPYDENAKFPEFKKFLTSVMDTQSYRTYFRQVCGYWLIGEAKEQLAFIMLGTGSNGKGTITRLMEDILGREYCTTISPTFIKNASKGSPNGPTPALMSLRKARVIWCTESEHKRGVDEVFFKQLTGNDTMTGRHNYGDQQFFTPPGKLVLTTNVMPDWSHDDNALWRRVKVLPFKHSFNAKTGRNNDLNSLLKQEASGILNWMIDGAKTYLNQGFNEPEEVTIATKEAREKSDSVHLWTEQECQPGEKFSVGSKNAHDAYVVFTRHRGIAPVSTRIFKQKMGRLGFQSKRFGSGFIFQGIKLFSQ